MLHIQYVALKNEIQISEGTRVLGSLAFHKAQSIDGDIAAVCNDARNHPTDKFPVPNTSFARGLKPRNYGKFGVAL